MTDTYLVLTGNTYIYNKMMHGIPEDITVLLSHSCKIINITIILMVNSWPILLGQ